MAMTAQVKAELANNTITKSCCRKAEVSSILRFAGGLHIVSGRIVVDYGDRQEVVTGGQAYHVEPGHRITFEEDSEAVEFTPTDELEQTLAAVRDAAAEAGRAG